jgi:hypothetical protein
VNKSKECKDICLICLYAHINTFIIKHGKILMIITALVSIMVMCLQVEFIISSTTPSVLPLPSASISAGHDSLPPKPLFLMGLGHS